MDGGSGRGAPCRGGSLQISKGGGWDGRYGQQAACMPESNRAGMMRRGAAPCQQGGGTHCHSAVVSRLRAVVNWGSGVSSRGQLHRAES